MEKCLKLAEKYREVINKSIDYLWANPELGYREFKTSDYLKKEFIRLGYKLSEFENIPGFITEVDTGKKGPTICIFGEMDALPCPLHKAANKETGAVHACGHNVHASALLGIACMLTEKEVLEGLCGKIKLCAVPSEEADSTGYIEELIKKGIVKSKSGKVEAYLRGYLDDVDMCLMVHATPKRENGVYAEMVEAQNGIIFKKITYKGKATHGAAPYDGINALTMATTGINNVNAIRETFTEKEVIRLTSIISKGGNVFNVIPDDVVIDTCFRGAVYFDLLRENERVNRAYISSALAVGGNVKIEDVFAYPTFEQNNDLNIIYANNIKQNFGEDKVQNAGIEPCSTDMGNISCIMPAIQPRICCTKGISHSSNFEIADKEIAGVINVQIQVSFIRELLKDNGKKAKEVIANYKPIFKNKEEYLSVVDKKITIENAIEYLDNGEVKIKYKTI